VSGDGLGWVDGGTFGHALALRILEGPATVVIDADMTHTDTQGRAQFLLGLAAMIRATVTMDPEARALGDAPFSPDWTVAPAATLHEVMTERGHTVASLAALIGITTYGTGHYWPLAKAAAGIRAVLAKDPMPDQFPAAMHHAMGGAPSASFWANHEAQYRADLAAGRKDVTGRLPEPRET